MPLEFSNTTESTVNDIENEHNSGDITGHSGGSSSGGTSSNVTTTITEGGNRIIDASLVPYARRIWITVEGRNLRPDTDYYRLYWGANNALDDLDVEIAFGNHTLSDGTPIGASENWDQWKGSVVVDATLDQPNIQFIKTDSNGYFKCAIMVPENTPIGVHNIQVDEEGENYGVGGHDSKANTMFQAHGLQYTDTGSIITTEIVEIVDNNNDPDPIDLVSGPGVGCLSSITDRLDFIRDGGTAEEYDAEHQGNICIGTVDPLAQSIAISSTPIYASSINLYVRTKATDNNLVVQLREMVNGYPGKKIVPGSTVIMSPDEINISNDGQTATVCNFTDPVYLKANTQYCIVIIAYSRDYELWHSEIGKRDISTNVMVERQPLLGSMFLSQDNSTWTAVQNFDLKFELNKCNFSYDGVNEYINFKPMTGSDAYNLIQKTSQFVLGSTQIIHPNTDLKWYYKYDRTTEGATSSSLGLTSEWRLFKPSINLDLQNLTTHVRLRLEFSGGTLSPIINRERAGVFFLQNLLEGAYVSRTMRFTSVNPETLRPDHLRGVFFYKNPSHTRIKIYGAINSDLDNPMNINWRHITTIENNTATVPYPDTTFTANVSGGGYELELDTTNLELYTGQEVRFSGTTGGSASTFVAGTSYYIHVDTNNRVYVYATKAQAELHTGAGMLTPNDGTGTMYVISPATFKQSSAPGGWIEGEFQYSYKGVLNFLNDSGITTFKLKIELEVDEGYQASTPLVRKLMMIATKRDS